MVDTLVQIRPYRPGDEEAINNLFNFTFNKSRTIQAWNWKFTENPAGKDPSEWITIGENNGKIVGHYASMPMKIKYHNTQLMTSQYVDIMLDPSARKNTLLFWNLVKSHFENNKGTIPFTFGFPNEVAYQTVKIFLGSKDLVEMVQLFKRFSLRSMLKKRFPWFHKWIIHSIHSLSKVFYGFGLSMRRVDKNITIRVVDEFDERINRFWERLKDRYEIMTVRNLPYLNWRYKDRRYKVIIGEENKEVVGYVVTKIEDCGDAKVGYIVDILSDNDKTSSIMSGVLKSFIEQDVDYVLCALLRLDPLCAHLKRMGFKEHKEIKPIQVVVTPLAKEVDTEYLLNQKNWHLTYGDTDGF